MKTKTSQAQSKRFVFRVAPAFKRGVHRSAQRRYDLGWVSSTTAAPGDAVRVLSSVFIILQNDTRNSIYHSAK